MKKIISLIIAITLSVLMLTSCVPRTVQQQPQNNVTSPPAQQTPQPGTGQQPMGNMPIYYIYTANEGDASVSVVNITPGGMSTGKMNMMQSGMGMTSGMGGSAAMSTPMGGMQMQGGMNGMGMMNMSTPMNTGMAMGNEK